MAGVVCTTDILPTVYASLPTILNPLLETSGQLLFQRDLSATIALLSEESDDDDEILLAAAAICPRAAKRTKIGNFVSEVVPCYQPDDFAKHFRLQRSTTEHVWQLLGAALEGPKATTGRPRRGGNINLLLPIWTMSNQESFRGVCDRFGVGTGHGYRMFTNFCKVCTLRVQEFICWPTGQEFIANVTAFDNLRPQALQGVVGCIDGSYIPIRGLQAENASYCNRKQFRAIILQGVCDSKKRFIDVFAGWPGSSHDARVWRNSPLYEKLQEQPGTYLPNDTHLLGDSAYPLEPILLTPYKDNGFLTQKQKHYNKKLSSSRAVIENAFGLLKSRFRRMRFLDMIRMELAAKVITTACILHNICVDQNDVLNDVEPDDGLLGGACGADVALTNVAGAQKRNRIANELFALR